MRVSALIDQSRELLRVCNAAAHRHGCGRIWAARRARALRVGKGFEYGEALATGLLDPAVPADRARRYVSEFQTTSLIQRLNPESLAAVTAEKTIFYRYFGALGLPVPRLYGVVGRAGGWSAGSGRPLADAGAATAFVDHELPDRFVVKPSAGHHGLGVRVLRRDADLLVDLDGRRWRGPELVAEIMDDREFDLFVVQQRLLNHPELTEICPTETLQTTRITTFAAADGGVQVVHASQKLGVSGGNVDNFRGGSTGNVLVEVDLSTGALGPPLSSAAVAPGAAGAVLPDWPAAVDLARRAARHLLPQRTMGFDVALTPEGPVLVEANRGYDPCPSPRFGDVVGAMRRAVADGGPVRLGGVV